MNTTLKKAAELSRLALSTAKAITPEKTVSVTAFTISPVADVVDAARTKFETDQDRIFALLDAAYAIRESIGRANAAAEIDGKLTRIALIDAKIERMGKGAKSDELGIMLEEGVSSDSMAELVARVDQAKEDLKDAETRRYGRSDIVINVLGTVEKAVQDDVLADLRRERSALKDEIAAANFTTMVVLSEETVNTLTHERLI